MAIFTLDFAEIVLAKGHQPVPILIGGLLAGTLLDRFDQRRLILLDNLVRGLVMTLIPLLYLFDLRALWHIYAVAAVYGLLMMISLAGGPALFPYHVLVGKGKPCPHRATGDSQRTGDDQFYHWRRHQPGTRRFADWLDRRAQCGLA